MPHVDILDVFLFSYVHLASYRKQKAKHSLYVKTIWFYYCETGMPLADSELCYLHTA